MQIDIGDTYIHARIFTGPHDEVLFQGIQVGKTLADPLTIFPPNFVLRFGGLSVTMPVNAEVITVCDNVRPELQISHFYA